MQNISLEHMAAFVSAFTSNIAGDIDAKNVASAKHGARFTELCLTPGLDQDVSPA